MSRGVLVCAVIAALAVAGVAAGSAAGCPCHEFCGRVLAHGSSPNGVPWRITGATQGPTDQSRSTAMINFLIGKCGEYSEAGYLMALELPITRRPYLSALRGSDIDDFPESALSGLTTSRVTRLEVTMSDGTTMTVEPQLAPRSLWRQMPWLRGLRCFYQFYGAGTEAVKVDAYDRAGRHLGSDRPYLGSFN